MKLKLHYIQTFTDRFGRQRFYYRRPNFKRVPLPPPGTPGFLEAYELAASNEPEPVGSARIKSGTMSALAVAYLASHRFTSFDPATQAKYRAIVGKIVAEHGTRKTVELQRVHIAAMLDTKAATPGAANNWLYVLRKLMQFALAERLRDDDPTASVKSLRYVSKGHKSWSEENIQSFEAHHPVGSMPRLAMALMLYTGARISDAVRLSRSQIKNGLLTYTQHKNRNRKPITLVIPVHPELAKIIDATPAQGLVYLTTGFNKPFKSSASLGNWMRARCHEAGLPDCSSHGLRKGMARRLAESGMTPHQIMAITGHTTLKEVTRYTAAADQARLAVEAMRGMVAGGAS